MSGLSLRALLEGSHLSLDLKVNGSAASPLSSQDSVSKVISPSFPSYDASRAYLNRANIWDAPEPDASGGDGGFNLEYMDLEEFLQETGLETLDRAAIFSSSPAAYVDDSSACSEVNCSATPAATAPGMSAAMTSALHSPSAAARLTASPATLTTDVAAHAAASVASAEAVHLSSQPSSPADSCDESSTAGSVDGSVTIADVPEIPSNGKMSSRTLVQQQQQQRAAPVTELSSAVACIPGKEGFDPESHKFAPEELVPQPIIKKSRKVYVPDDLKDDRYWARRKKNNYAAKRSRDARRAKENQIIMRAAFLEQHNDELSTENKRLLAENKSLTALVQAYKKRLGDN